MDREIREIIKKKDSTSRRMTIKNNVRIIDTDNGSFVVKKKENSQNLDNIYNYLRSRSFDYFPSKIEETSKYELYEYVEDYNEPVEQKVLDMMYLLSLLHNKTTFYKEVDFDYYKEIYEKIKNNVDYIFNYYTELITNIEKKIYMSPSEYLIARNISKIYYMINYCQVNLEKWYELIKEKKKMRVVNIHNNLRLDHYIKNTKPYFISWNKSRIDSPIYDLLNFYHNHYLDFDFSELFHFYEERYKLKEDEKLLLFIYMSIPPKIDIDEREYELCKKCRNVFDYLYKTDALISAYSVSKN